MSQVYRTKPGTSQKPSCQWLVRYNGCGRKSHDALYLAFNQMLACRAVLEAEKRNLTGCRSVPKSVNLDDRWHPKVNSFPISPHKVVKSEFSNPR